MKPLLTLQKLRFCYNTSSYVSCLHFPCSLWLPGVKPSTFAGVDLLFPSSLSSDTCQKPQLRLQETVTVKSLLLEIKTATNMVTILWSNLGRNVIHFGYRDLSFCGFSEQNSHQKKLRQFPLKCTRMQWLNSLRFLLKILYPNCLQFSKILLFKDTI